MDTTRDMTRGKPLSLMVSFALPIIGSFVLQQLYTLVDAAVVGRLIGVSAFASVGAAGFYSWMVLDIILGLTQGFGALFAQRFGAKDETGLRKAVTMSGLLSLLVGAVLTVLGIGLARTVLIAMRTPQELLPDTLTYLYWLLGGTLISIAYNLVGSLLRALGDSKTPLYAVLAASVINIALDVLLVLAGLGVAGVAIATVFSQLCATALCFRALGRVPVLRLSAQDFAPDKRTIGALLRMGGPLAFRNAVICVGGALVQRAINGYGVLFIAGTNATRRYYGLMEVLGAGIEGAAATFVGQNYGAGDVPRIREGMRGARRLAVVGSVTIAALVALLGRQLIGLLVVGTPEEIAAVVDIGYRNLLAAAACLPWLYMLTMHRAALQGMGRAFVPMLSGFVELAMRIVAVLALPPFIGVWGVYLADGIGWIAAAVLLVGTYAAVIGKESGARGAEPDMKGGAV